MIVNLSEMFSGFSDRLRPITFGLMLSKIFFRKNKTIEIIESKSKECPYLFTDLCSIKYFKVSKSKSSKKKNYLFNMSPFNSQITEKNLKKHMPFEFEEADYLIDEWKKSYKLIKPAKKITKKIERLKLPKQYVGVHIRSTDKVVSLYTRLFEIPSKTTITQFELKFFIKNLPFLICKNINCKNVFVACDDKKLKGVIIKTLTDHKFNVYFNNNKFFKKQLRQTNGEDFLIDLFSLSNSRLIISSTGGGVPTTAQLLSKKKIKVINYLDKKNIFYLLKILNFILYNARKSLKRFN